MSSVMGFKVVLLSLVAIIGLELLTKRLRRLPAAARVELLHLHRSGMIHDELRTIDELLTILEHDLDLQEIAAVHGRG